MGLNFGHSVFGNTEMFGSSPEDGQVLCVQGDRLIAVSIDGISESPLVVSEFNDGDIELVAERALLLHAEGAVDQALVIKSDSTYATGWSISVEAPNITTGSIMNIVSTTLTTGHQLVAVAPASQSGDIIYLGVNTNASCAMIGFHGNSTTCQMRLQGCTTGRASPQEGDFWYDDTNHVLKYYNGTAVKTIAVV